MALDAESQTVTVALLKQQTKHLDELSLLRHEALIERWDRHEKQHETDAEAFATWCERVAEIETAQKVGVARMAAAVSAGAVLLAEAIRWGWTAFRE